MSNPILDVNDLVPSTPLPQEVSARVTLVDVVATPDMPQFTAVFVEGHSSQEVEHRAARLMESAGVTHSMFHAPARTSRGTWAVHGYLHS